MTKIWITWEKHRRTSELLSELKCVKLFEFELEAPRFIRYPVLLCKSLLVLLKTRPRVVMVQNPSVVLTFFVVIFSRIGRFHSVVDAHNEGISPFYVKFNWLLPLYTEIQKRADLTIVTNIELARKVRDNGGRTFVLEDKIPEFNNVEHIDLQGVHNLVFICTFEKDEPYLEVIKAARLIDNCTCIYVTGKYQKIPFHIIKNAPSNIIFTGFLADQQYINLLNSADIIIDLTLMENCLVCGAYEAVALGKPLILSDTKALRDYFTMGAIYTKNTSEAIAKAINHSLENIEKLKQEVSSLKYQLESAWKEKIAVFNSIIVSHIHQNRG